MIIEKLEVPISGKLPKELELISFRVLHKAQ
jgi:hypothetical protein